MGTVRYLVDGLLSHFQSFPWQMEELPCLICNSPITSTHLGLDVCRACFLFFKRTKLAGRKFSCPGTGSCIIKKDDNSTCRKCRFDRCVAVGMEYEGPLRKSRKLKDVEIVLESSSSSTDHSPSVSRPRPEESILERIEKEYKATCASRLVQERNLHTIFTLPRVPHPYCDLFLSNLSFSKKSFQITVLEAMTFVKKAFPTINELTIEEQRSVLKNFVTRFNIIDAHYRTVKLWDDEKFYMFSLTTCFDMRRLETWIPETEKPIERENLLGALKSYANDQLSIIFPTLRKAEVTDTEFYGVLSLALCDLADVNSIITDRTARVIEEIRMETLSDLQRYFRNEMGLEDYSTRLGNLLTISLLSVESARMMKEEFRMYTTVFDMYANDDVIRELFL